MGLSSSLRHARRRVSAESVEVGKDLASREFIAVLLFDEWHPLDLSLRFASFRHGTVALHELPVLQLSGILCPVLLLHANASRTRG